MAKVLYITYDGILEPLGQSQVLNYLEKLSEDHEITLMSFEKKQDTNDRRLILKLIQEFIYLRYQRILLFGEEKAIAIRFPAFISGITCLWFIYKI